MYRCLMVGKRALDRKLYQTETITGMTELTETTVGGFKLLRDCKLGRIGKFYFYSPD